MELNELKSMWQAHEVKLEKSLKLNLHCLALIQAQKVRSKLAPLLWLRVVELLFLVIVIWWLAGFLFNHFSEWAYAFAALGLIVFYAIAFINCLKQIILIKQMDYSDNIVSLQSSLEKLQTHVVDYLRLTFLVVPTYLAYPIVGFKALGFDILAHLHGNWWMGQIIFSVLLVPICLYKEISYKNMHKNWVRIIIGTAGNRVVKSMEFIKELDKIRQEENENLKY